MEKMRILIARWPTKRGPVELFREIVNGYGGMFSAQFGGGGHYFADGHDALTYIVERFDLSVSTME